MEKIIIDQWNGNRKKLKRYFNRDIPEDVTKFHLHGKAFCEWFDYIVEAILKTVINSGKDSLRMRILSRFSTADPDTYGYFARYILTDADFRIWILQDHFGTIDVMMDIPLPQKTYYVNFAMYCSLMYIQGLKMVDHTSQSGILGIIDLDKVKTSDIHRRDAEVLLEDIEWDEIFSIADSLLPQDARTFKRMFSRTDTEEELLNIRLNEDYSSFCITGPSNNRPGGAKLLSFLSRHLQDGFLVFLRKEDDTQHEYPPMLIKSNKRWKEVLERYSNYQLKSERIVLYGTSLDEIYSEAQRLYYL